MAKAKILDMCYKCNGAGAWTKNTSEGDVVIDPCPVCDGDKWLDTNKRLDLTSFAVLGETLDTIISMLSE